MWAGVGSVWRVCGAVVNGGWRDGSCSQIRCSVRAPRICYLAWYYSPREVTVAYLRQTAAQHTIAFQLVLQSTTFARRGCVVLYELVLMGGVSGSGCLEGSGCQDVTVTRFWDGVEGCRTVYSHCWFGQYRG